MAEAELAVLIALMAHKLAIIERKLAQCRMVRKAKRMTTFERTMAVEWQYMEKQYNNRHYHLAQQILWQPLWRL